MKNLRLRDKWGYHDTASLAIIKILDRLGYIYLEINALY